MFDVKGENDSTYQCLSEEVHDPDLADFAWAAVDEFAEHPHDLVVFALVLVG